VYSNLKYGYKREDGYIFAGYTMKRGKKYEDFRSPKAFERQKKYHKANKKKVYDEISELYNKEKLKHGCAHCGYKGRPEALDHHHPDPSNKIRAVSSHFRSSYKQFEKMKKEWEKCIVLCANCHRIETKRILDARN
jgi:5-methylcytosine-specific restriction endonuclease McrA